MFFPANLYLNSLHTLQISEDLSHYANLLLPETGSIDTDEQLITK